MTGSTFSAAAPDKLWIGLRLNQRQHDGYAPKTPADTLPQGGKIEPVDRREVRTGLEG